MPRKFSELSARKQKEALAIPTVFTEHRVSVEYINQEFAKLMGTPLPNGQPQALRPEDDLAKGGVKYDHGKARYDLLPPEGAEAVATILAFGARKYAARNWEQGMDWSRPFSAAMRHLWAWWRGEKADPDSGYSHLWHAACNLFFLVTYEARGVGKDDRPI